eukprot:TRINITY_DN14256_c0_g1_i1.p1 TRINITY_DN14256_c0_g1~~TRINITY_DN14256_c0_g1_i1.p1  ORF type:complete len:585 (+),score=73.79 TRINITY_DN14256_c0_g1_i1:154-1755(+)
MTLFVMNLCITASLVSVVQDLKQIPADIWANGIFLIAAIICCVLFDARAFFGMFFDTRLLKDEPQSHPLPHVFGIWSASGYVMDASRTLSLSVVVLNWVAGISVLSSSLKLSIANPVHNYDTLVLPNPKIAHDLFSGELQLNPLLRSGNSHHWESYYAHVCVLYLMTYFLLNSAHRVGFRLGVADQAKRGATYLVFILLCGGFGGYLAETTRFFSCLVLVWHGLFPVVLATAQTHFARKSTVDTAALYEEAVRFQPKSASIRKHVPLALALVSIAVTLSALVVLAIKSLPGAVDSDRELAQHSDPLKGIHLQFCEEPYYYSSWAAQGVAFMFHMPYVPVFAILFGRRLTYDGRLLLVFQLFLQLWTGYGHYLPDPRVHKITEVSIMFAGLYFMQIVKITSDLPQGFSTLKAACVYVPFGWFVYSVFGLLTFILASTFTIPLVGMLNPEMLSHLHIASKVSPKHCVIGGLLVILTFSIIIAEGTFCQTLLAWKQLPYHAFFDCAFFQVVTTFFWFLAVHIENKEHGAAKAAKSP